jgi:hypothetical protein
MPEARRVTPVSASHTNTPGALVCPDTSFDAADTNAT